MLLAILAVAVSLHGELLPVRSYTTADGLGADRIDFIFADSRGFIWFCTPEGLTRFNGYRMTNFGTAEGLPHRAAQAMLETRPGEYLVGTAGGLAQFHAGGGGNKFTTYRPGGSDLENDITVLLKTSGRIWCGTGNGLFELLDGFKFGPQRLSGPFHGWDRITVTDIQEDSDGKLWVGTVDGIYMIAKDGGVARIAEENGVPANVVNALLPDRNGGIWAATRGGLAYLGGARGRIGLLGAHASANALAYAPDGAIWIASDRISRLLPGGHEVALQAHTRAHGLRACRKITFTI